MGKLKLLWKWINPHSHLVWKEITGFKPKEIHTHTHPSFKHCEHACSCIRGVLKLIWKRKSHLQKVVVLPANTVLLMPYIIPYVGHVDKENWLLVITTDTCVQRLWLSLIGEAQDVSMKNTFSLNFPVRGWGLSVHVRFPDRASDLVKYASCYNIEWFLWQQ